MKITKLGHCCLLIEHKGKRILTDPGAYSTAQNTVTGVDIILITHEHADHLHLESLETVLKNNSGAKIFTNTGVGKILSEKGIAYEVINGGGIVTVDGIPIEGIGDTHQEIYGDLARVHNTGYFVDNKFFYPGDVLANPGKPVDVLALPVVAPWTTIKMVIDYALEVKPRIALPLHDGMIVPERVGLIHRLPPQILGPQGITFVPLRERESWEE